METMDELNSLYPPTLYSLGFDDINELPGGIFIPFFSVDSGLSNQSNSPRPGANEFSYSSAVTQHQGGSVAPSTMKLNGPIANPPGSHLMDDTCSLPMGVDFSDLDADYLGDIFCALLSPANESADITVSAGGEDSGLFLPPTGSKDSDDLNLAALDNISSPTKTHHNIFIPSSISIPPLNSSQDSFKPFRVDSITPAYDKPMVSFNRGSKTFFNTSPRNGTGLPTIKTPKLAISKDKFVLRQLESEGYSLFAAENWFDHMAGSWLDALRASAPAIAMPTPVKLSGSKITAQKAKSSGNATKQLESKAERKSLHLSHKKKKNNALMKTRELSAELQGRSPFLPDRNSYVPPSDDQENNITQGARKSEYGRKRSDLPRKSNEVVYDSPEILQKKPDKAPKPVKKDLDSLASPAPQKVSQLGKHIASETLLAESFEVKSKKRCSMEATSSVICNDIPFLVLPSGAIIIPRPLLNQVKKKKKSRPKPKQVSESIQLSTGTEDAPAGTNELVKKPTKKVVSKLIEEPSNTDIVEEEPQPSITKPKPRRRPAAPKINEENEANDLLENSIETVPPVTKKTKRKPVVPSTDPPAVPPEGVTEVPTESVDAFAKALSRSRPPAKKKMSDSVNQASSTVTSSPPQVVDENINAASRNRPKPRFKKEPRGPAKSLRHFLQFYVQFENLECLSVERKKLDVAGKDFRSSIPAEYRPSEDLVNSNDCLRQLVGKNIDLKLLFPSSCNVNIGLDEYSTNPEKNSRKVSSPNESTGHTTGSEDSNQSTSVVIEKDDSVINYDYASITDAYSYHIMCGSEQATVLSTINEVNEGYENIISKLTSNSRSKSQLGLFVKMSRMTVLIDDPKSQRLPFKSAIDILNEMTTKPLPVAHPIPSINVAGENSNGSNMTSPLNSVEAFVSSLLPKRVNSGHEASTYLPNGSRGILKNGSSDLSCCPFSLSEIYSSFHDVMPHLTIPLIDRHMMYQRLNLLKRPFENTSDLAQIRARQRGNGGEYERSRDSNNESSIMRSDTLTSGNIGANSIPPLAPKAIVSNISSNAVSNRQNSGAKPWITSSAALSVGSAPKITIPKQKKPRVIPKPAPASAETHISTDPNIAGMQSTTVLPSVDIKLGLLVHHTENNNMNNQVTSEISNKVCEIDGAQSDVDIKLRLKRTLEESDEQSARLSNDVKKLKTESEIPMSILTTNLVGASKISSDALVDSVKLEQKFVPPALSRQEVVSQAVEPLNTPHVDKHPGNGDSVLRNLGLLGGMKLQHTAPISASNSAGIQLNPSDIKISASVHSLSKIPELISRSSSPLSNGMNATIDGNGNILLPSLPPPPTSNAPWLSGGVSLTSLPLTANNSFFSSTQAQFIKNSYDTSSPGLLLGGKQHTANTSGVSTVPTANFQMISKLHAAANPSVWKNNMGTMNPATDKEFNAKSSYLPGVNKIQIAPSKSLVGGHDSVDLSLQSQLLRPNMLSSDRMNGILLPSLASQEFAASQTDFKVAPAITELK